MTDDKKDGEEERQALLWDMLPPEVKTNVLGWLPLRSLFRCRQVCKSWNSTISSPSFVHFRSLLSSSALNRPWLCFFTPKSFDFLLAFDFDALSWFRFDMGFLSSMLSSTHICSAPSTSAPCGLIWCTGSASGLLLLDFCSSLYVSNPLNRSLIKLPPFKSIEVVVTQGFSTSHTRGIFTCENTDEPTALRQETCSTRGSVGKNGEKGVLGSINFKNALAESSSYENMTRNSHSPHYCVISIGKVKRGLVIEVFCVGRNSWEIVDSMPSWFIITHDRMLECDGLFYSLLSHPMGMLVIGDYVTEGTYWRIESLPLKYGAEPRRLLTCQNSIYMVCRADAYCNHFVIWEYQAVSKSWKKLQDMPDHIREDINCISTSNWADCVGVGWHICFRSIGTLKVLTYNVREGLWSWLPEPSPLYDTLFARGIEFEPKLDYTQSLEYGIMQKSSPY